jgi:hypothetical protein
MWMQMQMQVRVMGLRKLGRLLRATVSTTTATHEHKTSTTPGLYTPT